jgi:hypothetical protein
MIRAVQKFHFGSAATKAAIPDFRSSTKHLEQTADACEFFMSVLEQGHRRSDGIDFLVYCIFCINKTMQQLICMLFLVYCLSR